jgi:predicted ATPase
LVAHLTSHEAAVTIRNLSFSNFKSFASLEIALDKLNVLIGANASGKSNFIEIFRFVSDIAQYGLQNAVSMHGGAAYITNAQFGLDIPVCIEFTAALQFPFPLGRSKEGLVWGASREVKYELIIGFDDPAKPVRVISERVTVRFSVTTEPLFNEEEIRETRWKGEITLRNKNGHLDIQHRVPSWLEFERDYVLSAPNWGGKQSTSTILEEKTPFAFPIVQPFRDYMSAIKTYDIDPKAPKRASPITGRGELEDDGRNLAVAIHRIAQNPEEWRRFSNLVQDTLPFVRDFDVDALGDKSLLLKMRENYCRDVYFPASFASDGTVSITALIIALFFDSQTRPLITFEEPERAIHPQLISKVVSLLQDASRKRQVIVSTHNPEIVRFTGLKNLLLVFRDDEGFSHILKPADSEEIKAFLHSDLGVAELYVNGLLNV